MHSAVRLAERPAHIPAESQYDFDMFLDPALLSDPHERVTRLRQEAPPLFWTPYNGGHWMVIRHEDAFRVLREPDSFSSSPYTPEQMKAMMARIPPGMPRLPQTVPVTMDPPEHTKYRLPLQRVFAPKTIAPLKHEIEALAISLVDAIKEEGSGDFIPMIAEQFPVRVFLKMMGLQAERLPEFRALVREVFAPRGPDPMEMGLRIRKVADSMLDVIMARREEPKDDIISLLWALEIDGEPMSLELMEDYSTLLFLAGLDTVINAIGFGMRHLAANPDFQNELRANPALIPQATEELLRRYTFTIPIRRVTHDLELGGQSMKSGDLIQIFLPAADLDPKVFPSPEVFDATRESKAHMAFGAGPHWCVGAHLARIELQTLYRVVLEKLPPFRLDPDQPATFHAGNLLVVASLPLRWD